MQKYSVLKYNRPGLNTPEIKPRVSITDCSKGYLVKSISTSYLDVRHFEHIWGKEFNLFPPLLSSSSFLFSSPPLPLHLLSSSSSCPANPTSNSDMQMCHSITLFTDKTHEEIGKLELLYRWPPWMDKETTEERVSCA